MKLRLDLLDQLTEEDLLEEILANNPRYKPEPLFSKTQGFRGGKPDLTGILPSGFGTRLQSLD